MRYYATLILVFLRSNLLNAVCFGPCNGGVYETRLETVEDEKQFVVECSRFYAERQNSLSCVTNMKTTWDLNTPAVNQFESMAIAYDNGREAAERACEEVCASSNSCEAFAVSSDQHVSENKWQCTVYYACPSKQYNEHLDLYERQEPKACLAKATTYDGVFVNFLEVNGLVSQTTRTLRVPVQPFGDLHLRVNGIFNKSDLAYRPYQTPPKPFCKEVDSECIILHAGGYSFLVIFVFLAIVLFNSCVLWVSLTKQVTQNPVIEATTIRPISKSGGSSLRRKRVGSSNMYF